MEVRAMLRDKIPGPTRVGDNGLTLQAAETIRALEMYNARAADQLESLQNLQSCNASMDDHLKPKFSVHGQHTCGTSVPEGSDLMAVGQKPDDGCTKLNAMLPGVPNLKGTRLFARALEYLTDLEDEKAKLDAKIAEHEKIEINAPIPPQSTHWTSEASDPEPCIQIIGLHGLGAATPSVGEKAAVYFRIEENLPTAYGDIISNNS